MSQIARAVVTFVIVAIAVLAAGAGAPPARAELLTVLTRDGGPIGGPAIRHGETFTAATGISVAVVQRRFQNLYGEIMIGFVTGKTQADVLLVPSAWLPDFAPYLSPVPDALINSPLVEGIHPTFRDALMRWQGKWMAMTLDGDLHMGAYRRDLFEDAQNRADFQRRFGRPLAPPRDWRDYLEIAGFFNGRPGPDGKPLAGTLEAFAEGGQRLWFLFSHAAAYTHHPAYPGHFFFDPETMAPEIANPAWERALGEYLATMKAGPDDAATIASHDVRARFAAGAAAMAIDWSDIGVLAADRSRSAIADKVGFFVLPGSADVWNPHGRQWDRLPAARPVPFLAFGGWIAAVPLSARDPQRAWDYIAWLAAPERADRDVMDGTSGFNPYRLSQLTDTAGWQRLLGKGAAEAYLAVLRASLSSPDTARDLRLPGYPAYMAALDKEVSKVIAGERPIHEALEAVAAQWEQITDRLGRASQLRHYREAMGLPEVTP